MFPSGYNGIMGQQNQSQNGRVLVAKEAAKGISLAFMVERKKKGLVTGMGLSTKLAISVLRANCIKCYLNHLLKMKLRRYLIVWK